VGQDRHSKEWQKNQFCAKVPCEASCVAGTKKNYQEVCKPSAWFDWEFGQKDGMKPYEAHHILCWSCVSSCMFAKNPKCRAILRGTKWCVNKKRNMIALPLWGHTVKWYKKKAGRPKFEDLPNHNRDHGRYLDDVKTALKALIKAAKAEKDDHGKLEDIDIAGELDDKADDFKKILKTRGSTRGGPDKKGKPHIGTHACISLGMAEPDSLWFMPFSMAAAPKVRHFSTFKTKWDAIRLAEKMHGV
jgi:hypothetical protein